MSTREVSLRLLGSAMAAFCLFTLAWVVWALLTPGDYFGNGSRLVLPTLGLAVVLGLIAGFHVSDRLRPLVLVSAALSLCFWIFMPDGWWAHPLPRG